MKLSMTLLCLVMGTTSAFANEAKTQWNCQYDKAASQKLVDQKNAKLKPNDEIQAYDTFDRFEEIRVNVAGTKSEALAQDDEKNWKSLSIVASYEDEMEATVKATAKRVKFSYEGSYHYGNNSLELDLNLVTGEAVMSQWESDSCSSESSAGFAVYQCK